MRLYGILAACLCLAGIAVAESETDVVRLSVTSGTNTALQLTADASAQRGYVDAIYIDASASATADVSVVWMPAYSGFSAVTLARITNCSADAVIRPVWPETGTDGSAPDVTNAVSRFSLVGGQLRLIVTNLCTSNLTWTVLAQIEK